VRPEEEKRLNFFLEVPTHVELGVVVTGGQAETEIGCNLYFLLIFSLVLKGDGSRGLTAISRGCGSLFAFAFYFVIQVYGFQLYLHHLG
jgi:hypothetical protein